MGYATSLFQLPTLSHMPSRSLNTSDAVTVAYIDRVECVCSLLAGMGLGMQELLGASWQVAGQRRMQDCDQIGYATHFQTLPLAQDVGVIMRSDEMRCEMDVANAPCRVDGRGRPCCARQIVQPHPAGQGPVTPT